MRRILPVVLLVVGVSASAACRQPDGPLPQPTAEDPNRIGDISRDLVNVWGRTNGALNDLVDDLQNITQTPPPVRLTRGLVSDIAACLTAKPISEQASQQLAKHLFVLMNSRELSHRQIRKVADDVGHVLKQTGGDEARTERAKEGVRNLQQAIASNKKRWYHLF